MREFHIQVIDQVSGGRTPPVVVPEDEFNVFRESLLLGVQADKDFENAMMLLLCIKDNGRIIFDLSPLVTVRSYLDGFSPRKQSLSDKFLSAVTRFDIFRPKKG